jgi:hypothetical protein
MSQKPTTILPHIANFQIAHEHDRAAATAFVRHVSLRAVRTDVKEPA